jgi:hypothetical protein
MSEEKIPQPINNTVIDETEIREIITEGSNKQPANISLQSLILLVNAERLRFLHDKTHQEFAQLKERQQQVSTLHKLQKGINNTTSAKGEFDCSNNKDLQDLLQEAKKLGVETIDGKFKYTAEEKDRLIENIRMTVEDLNVQNDMQMQTITNLNNERYESYQLARTIIKPLHDDKINKARAIAGR